MNFCVCVKYWSTNQSLERTEGTVALCGCESRTMTAENSWSLWLRGLAYQTSLTGLAQHQHIKKMPTSLSDYDVNFPSSACARGAPRGVVSIPTLAGCGRNLREAFSPQRLTDSCRAGGEGCLQSGWSTSLLHLSPSVLLIDKNTTSVHRLHI